VELSVVVPQPHRAGHPLTGDYSIGGLRQFFVRSFGEAEESVPAGARPGMAVALHAAGELKERPAATNDSGGEPR
jgi:hypothetical protein